MNSLIEVTPIIKELVINVTINKTSYKALLDTGANINLIRKNVVNNEKLPIQKISDTNARSVDGKVINLPEETQLDLRISLLPDKTFAFCARVISDSTYDIIISSSFLQENQSVIDFRDKTLLIDGDVIDLERPSNFYPEKYLFEKTRVCSISSFSESSSFEDFIKSTKLRNPILGTIPNTNHSIQLLSNKPVCNKPIPVPIKKLEDTKKELDRLLDLGVIVRSNSNYSSAAFPIYKKNGNVRPVVDFCNLNDITVRQNFPLPRISDYLAQLKDSTIFSQIDLNMGVYQIPVAENDRHLTSFVILNQQFEFTRMPFGLCNAPRTFQSAMMGLFGHLSYVKICLDDILVHSTSIESHKKHLYEVLQILLDNGISINWSKTHLRRTEVKYLGHILSAEGCRPDISRIDNLKLQPPKNKREAMRVLGTLQWFRPYINQASHKFLFLTQKLKKDEHFQWSQDDTSKLFKIVSEIKQQTLLSYPNWLYEFTLETDASNYAIGAVLKQKGKLIGFFSYTLSGSELNYSITEKEYFAILKSTEHFRTIIFGQKILIYTDNRNILGNTDLSKIVERWKVILQDMNIQLKFITGKTNLVADYLSRSCSISIINPYEQLFSKLISWQEGIESNSENKIIQTTHGKFTVEKGRNRVLIPDNKAIEFVTNCHEILQHPGKSSLVLTLERFFKVGSLANVCASVVNRCQACLINKPKRFQNFQTTGFVFSDRPMEKVCIDILGSQPGRQCRYIAKRQSFAFSCSRRL